ncbi:MAG: KpsF/GutQ family sugar-phosphate isomerase [Desulfobacteraceae bacterium]|nr:KpsF/GutQ family sugar-phosphate isomerase [Desulfobacteraceae bacterium]
MVIEEAKEVLKKEAESILNLTGKIGPEFERMVDTILASSGRVVLAGIGKSGLICRKIVATLASTGTNAIFLHPVEAMHGDLGMVGKNDVFIAISNSGETGELNILLPSIKELGCPMIAFTGNPGSTMADLCDMVIDTGVEKEACPLGLAPTCSTTAQLAMGDALAVVLINKKNFKQSDFKRSHPGGALGQRLSCMAKEVMDQDSTPPTVTAGATMTQAIGVMEKFRLGAVLIIDQDNRLAGIITDGDVRHCIAKGMHDFDTITVEQVMSDNPFTIAPNALLSEALNIMEKHEITALPVTDGEKRLRGILHLHDILGKGAFKFNGS